MIPLKDQFKNHGEQSRLTISIVLAGIQLGDARSEKFNMIKLSSGFDGNFLVTYNGRLACFNRYDHSRFWILEDAQKHKWSSQNFLSPFGDCDASMDTDLNLTETAGGDLNLKEWQVTNPSVMAGDKSVSNGRVRDSLHVTFKLRPNLKMQSSSGRSDTYANTATNGAESTTISAHADEQDEVEIET
ncbi:hypothetical protein DY000_02012599 [Brassica cretica]|uniref:F-box associated beta-propeller type 3 domain-containing protein n=1 Tax=Brassica cretica TaxID=69181 RepID=A0ABQ7CP64_BRACR|nr:hypothetical protein DY000_02012599 [Brassica cretica]